MLCFIATAPVSIEVTGPSNAATYFSHSSYTIELDEDLPIGTEVANITAINPDPGTTTNSNYIVLKIKQVYLQLTKMVAACFLTVTKNLSCYLFSIVL